MPHHCLDLVEPTAEMSVTEFREASDAAVASIDGRGGRPLLVAGTGLYLTAILDRLEMPGTWPGIRAELESEADTLALHHRLRELDPAAAQKMEPNNRRRVVRALEVTLGSGRPFSSFGPGVGAFPPTDAVQIGIRWSRAALAERIEQRVRSMMDRGLLDEVTKLAATGLSITARQALGYKELLDHIEGDAIPRRRSRGDRRPDPPIRRPPGALVPARPPRTLDGHRSRIVAIRSNRCWRRWSPN